MKRTPAIVMILSLFLFVGFVGSASAGTEPSPFRSEIGAYRLNFVEGYALTVSQMVKAVLATPPNNTREVNAIKRLARQLNKLERLMALTSIDVIRLGCPPDDNTPGAVCPPDDMLPVANELSQVADHAQAMVLAIEAYLGAPPDDQIPPDGFIETLYVLLESAKVLYDSALGYMERLTATER